jgi:hypothetical protein
MDVSAAVQLERLEELERAVIELNPDQFVRKTDPQAGGHIGGSGTESTSFDPSLPIGSPTNSTEPSLSSF